MKIVEPISITDGMVGSAAGTVVEVEHPEWAGATTYSALQQVIVKGTQGTFVDVSTGTKNWNGICTSLAGDVYSCVYGASIWKQTGGVGLFVDQATITLNWQAMCASYNGDVYCSIYGGSIWKQTYGTAIWQDMSAGAKNYSGMCGAPNWEIYACVYAGSIWKSASGGASFADLGADAGTKNWKGMCAAPNGDIYACVYGGSIWKRTAGAGAFADLSTGNKNWQGMCATPNGDIYACVYGGSIWKMTGGTGSFVDLVTGNKDWSGMSASFEGSEMGINACVYGGGIWISTLEVIHKIYESLVTSNLAYYPPIDVRKTTPKWLEISSTNKWKVFDGKVNDQMEVVSPDSRDATAVYTITPGVAHNSIVLLNLSMASYRVQGTDGAYDSGTVSSTATDIVITNLGGVAANVLTITITNSGGLAKCGEIVIGNYYELGTMQPMPTVGIIDYSTKTADEFGDYTIVERTTSEKMNAVINIPYSSVDAVIAKLKDYRATPLVWIGNSSYACTIIYGYWKDWSIPVATRGKSILSIEIEGLT